MKYILAFVTALIAGVALTSVLWFRSPDHVYVSHFDEVMGTSLEIRVQAKSESAADAADALALDEIARESKLLSGYDPDSEFSRWMQSSSVPTKVSPELLEVLAAFDDWRVRTSGALDPATESIANVWRRAASEDRFATPAELTAALRRVRQRHWILDRAASTATHVSDVPLVLNSFTKSYIVDRAARRALSARGVSGVLLNAGGDVVVRGAWTQTVGVADPVANADNAPARALLAVHDGVVATSGGYKRGFDIKGVHYSHIIDPRTAQPAGDVLSATVVSSKAIDAGALATAFCVLTPAERAALAGGLHGVEFALVLKDGRRVESAGWPRVETPAPSAPASLGVVQTLYAADQANWNPAWQLTIALEIARTGGRRPYVAVWIEDKDRFPLRTIALWFDRKTRYLPELRGWFRGDRLRAMAEGSQIVDTVTSATRQAGKYTLQWDGKDNAGKPVRAGTYTVCIEASREHGTNQMIRQEMEFAGAPAHVTLAGGTEISGASLDYQQVAGR